MTSLCLSLILIGLLVSWPATWLARALGCKLNALDGAGVAGQVKAAPRRVPNTGGIGIFIAISLPMLAGLALFHQLDTSATAHWRTDFSFLPADLHDYADGIQQQTPAALILLGCLLILHIVGLIDDRRPLGPGVKLAIMLGAAVTTVLGTDTRLLTLLDAYGHGGHITSIALTVLWVLVITNAFNFLDNMDGLSAGVAGICAAAFLTTALVAQQWFIAALLALLLGALLGFLRYNFPWRERGGTTRGGTGSLSASDVGTTPSESNTGGATIFMGDSGSLIVGFLLAILSIRITYIPSPPHLLTGSHPHSFLILTPLIILAIPLYDFASVTLIRLSQGRSPFVGDMQHFSHRLVNHGLSRRSAVVVIYGCTAVTGIGAIALPKLEPWQASLVGVQTLLVLLVIALYEWSRSPSPKDAP
jgi:UDP-GlcNAc:undecaprenyl-phosphate GlcNAc-1-phosphate transferase